jgi:trimethylamine---corrinoid protein Co-methyltransferase
MKNTTYRILSEDDCAAIVEAACKILESVGCEIRNEKAISLLKNHGCVVEGNIVHIPEALTRQSIGSAPRQVLLYDREGNVAMKLDASSQETFYGAGTSAVYRYDLETGERRPVVKHDIYDAIVIQDRLENIDLTCGLGYISDCDQKLAGVWEARLALEATTKPFTMNCMDRWTIEAEVDLFAAASGGREQFLSHPSVLCACFPMSPMVHPDDALDNLIYLSELGLPINYIGTPAMGSTGPITMAGSMALSLADSLVGLVVSQIVNPGTPFVGTCFVDHMDLRTSGNAMTSPEFERVSAATGDLFRYIGIPSVAHMSCSDAVTFDQQAAFDIAAGVFLGEMSRVNINFFMGYLEGGMSSSLESLVYGNEVISYVRHANQPIEVDEDTLALETIGEVGPGGNFLSEEHTVDHMGGAWIPKLFYRGSIVNWIEEGQHNLFDRANSYAKELLSKGPRKRLSDDTIAQLDSIMRRIESEIA